MTIEDSVRYDELALEATALRASMRSQRIRLREIRLEMSKIRDRSASQRERKQHVDRVERIVCGQVQLTQ